MTRAYTSRPEPRAARDAWDYFVITEGREPIEMFFSPKTDFDDGRGPGWTAYMGERYFTSTWGAAGASIFCHASPDMIRYVIDKRAREVSNG